MLDMRVFFAIIRTSIDPNIMKFPIISTIAVAACALVSTVQAELKIASVNQGEVITSFHKTFDMQDRLQKQLTAIQADIKTRQEKLQALQKEDEAIRAKFDPSLPEAARRKLQEEHSAKLNEVQSYEQEMRTYVQRREVAFKEIQARELSLILKEVQEKVDAISSEKGIDVLIDTAAASAAGTKVFPFVKPTLDITPDVIKALNSSAPAGFNLEAELLKRRSAAGAAPAAN